MQPEINHPNGATGSRWSYCSNPASQCPTYKMAAVLGSNIQDILGSFIEEAEYGARLTLQKNRTGFTVQVVGAVRRSGGKESLDTSQYQATGNT